MHILVINDDGPPSNQSSPYIHAFIHYLQEAGHLVSVVLPHQQRSWIGKAHLVGQLTKPTYFRPGTLHQDDGTIHELPSTGSSEEWVLVDGTTATCAQLGLFHFFQDRPPVDLVVSGPNYGRNTTSVFSLSSGTLGGALEAAVCKRRAIALSFAFFNRNHDPELIADACKHSMKIIEHFGQNWDSSVDVYSINVPIKKYDEARKVMYTNLLENHWTSGSAFDEVDPDEENAQISSDPQAHEKQIRSDAEPTDSQEPNPETYSKQTAHKHRWFKWAPKFADVQKAVEQSAPGNDGWAIRQGYTSVTPLKANFMHAGDVQSGELKLSKSPEQGNKAGSAEDSSVLHAVIDADSYTLPLIHRALDHYALTYCRPLNYISSVSSLPSPKASNLLQISPYEYLDFEHHISRPCTSFVNSYIIRKALIRKHHLWQTVSHWSIKHLEDSTLQEHVPLTVTFEVDYAEYLDEALAECYELHESFAKNEARGETGEREWWILKPGMSDQGNGIRLFSSYEDLVSIFEEWEDEEGDDEDDDEEYDVPGTQTSQADSSNYGTMTSQLRHFTAQRYILHPLLLSPSSSLPSDCTTRKFHIRTYVLAFTSQNPASTLQVYVYDQMLALFAGKPYTEPSKRPDPDHSSSTKTHLDFDRSVHLTNTCLLPSDNSTPSGLEHSYNQNLFTAKSADVKEDPESRIQLLSDVIHGKQAGRDPVRAGDQNNNPDLYSSILSQIYATTATLFLSATTTQAPAHFQPGVPGCFEIFGVDWLVEEAFVNGSGDASQGERTETRGGGGEKVYLLEVNSFPDFARTGDRLKERVVGGLWREALGIVLRGGNTGGGEAKNARGGEGEGRKWWRWGQDDERNRGFESIPEPEETPLGTEMEQQEDDWEVGRMFKVLEVPLGR